MKTEIEVHLRNKNLEKEAKKILESNLEEVDKLSYLSAKLLKLNRYEQDSQLTFAKTELQDVIEKAVKQVYTRAKAKKIVINEDIEKVEVQGNHDSLVEAFVTILDNAVKYSPTGSQVKVSLNPKNNKAIVRIEDFGIGIKESDLPFIFNRFYRVDNSRQKEKTDGFGLGLSIAKKVVEKHKGKIEVTSTPKVGTTFIISLLLGL